MHRIGGLERQDGTGNISYDAANHELMTRLRQAKVDGIAVTLAVSSVLSDRPVRRDVHARRPEDDRRAGAETRRGRGCDSNHPASQHDGRQGAAVQGRALHESANNLQALRGGRRRERPHRGILGGRVARLGRLHLLGELPEEVLVRQARRDLVRLVVPPQEAQSPMAMTHLGSGI